MAKRNQPEKPVDKLSDKHREIVETLIEGEGFDYGFTNFNDHLDKIADERFQKLRKKWEEARKALMDYMGLDE